MLHDRSVSIKSFLFLFTWWCLFLFTALPGWTTSGMGDPQVLLSTDQQVLGNGETHLHPFDVPQAGFVDVAVVAIENVDKIGISLSTEAGIPTGGSTTVDGNMITLSRRFIPANKTGGYSVSVRDIVEYYYNTDAIYTLTVSHTPFLVDVFTSEPTNNNASGAFPINVNRSIDNYLVNFENYFYDGYAYDVDWYSIDVNEAGYLDVSLTGVSPGYGGADVPVRLFLTDESGYIVGWTSEDSGQTSTVQRRYIAANKLGTYRIQIDQDSIMGEWHWSANPYNFVVNHTPLPTGAYDNEPVNNEAGGAVPITIGTVTTDYLIAYENFFYDGFAGDTDWYSFEINQPGQLDVAFTGVGVGVNTQLALYDAQGNLLAFGMVTSSDQFTIPTQDITSDMTGTFQINVKDDQNSEWQWSDSPYTMTVTFTLQQYSLTVDISGSGSVTGDGIVCPDYCSKNYDNITVVTLTASPDPGWVFDSWSGGLTGSTSPDTVTVDANMIVTATFLEDSDGDGVPDVSDGCPADSNKIAAGLCGCGALETDTDNDGSPDCVDECPNDPDKNNSGICGCGVADTDSDNDGTLDCNDNCPLDPDKTEEGICGCGTHDVDSDGDGTLDCNDNCPNDADKTEPGICGCGVADIDSDGDGTPDCNDNCASDPNKVEPGLCGCGVAETDTDGDMTPDCIDNCPNDPNKTEGGICECGIADTDTDGDGTPDCIDICTDDPKKTDPGQCGCGEVDADTDGDGIADCIDNCPETPNSDQSDIDSDGIGDACDVLPGDVNGSGLIDLKDAILAIQVLTGTNLSNSVHEAADVNGDGKIGLEEAIFDFQVVAQIRELPMGQALLGPLAGATVNVYRLTNLNNPVYTALTDGEGYFYTILNGGNADEYVLVEAAGGEDTDADDDGIEDLQPTPNYGKIHALMTVSEFNTGGFKVSTLTDIAWQYTKNLIGQADVEGLKFRLDELSRTFLTGDINGDSVLDAGDITGFIPSDTAHKDKLNFDFQVLHAEEGDGNSIISCYHDNLPDIQTALLDDTFGSRLTRFPSADSQSNKVKLEVAVFGQGQVTGVDHGINIDTASPDSEGNVAEAFFDPFAEEAVTLIATPTEETEIVSWHGCDSVSEDQTQCICQMRTDHLVTLSFGYTETELKEGLTLVDLTEETVTISQDMVTLDVTLTSGNITSLDNLVAGDVVVSGSGSGFLRKVVSVELIAPSQYRLTTEDVALEDVISQGSGLLYKELTHGDLEPTATVRTPYSIPGVDTAESVYMLPGDGPDDRVFRFVLGQTSQDGRTPLESLGGALTWTDPDTGAELTLNGNIDVTIDIETGVSFNWFKLENFTFIPWVNATESLNLTVSGELETPKLEKKLATFHFHPIKFTIGLVPVVVEPQVDLVIGINAKLGAELFTGISFNQTVRAGIVYNCNAGLNLVKGFMLTHDFTKPTVSAYAEVLPYVKAVSKMKIYGITGPGVFLRGYLKLKGEADKTVFRDELCSSGILVAAYAGMNAGVDWDLGLLEKVLGKWSENVDLSVTFYQNEWLLRNWNVAGECAEPPYMEVQGLNIFETVQQGSGEVISQQYIVKNSGELPMDWEIDFIGDNAISVSPDSGNLGQDDTAIVIVSINTGYLSAGNYRNSLYFNNLYDPGLLAGYASGSTTRQVNVALLPQDTDGDGYPLVQDCNDNNSAINPGAEETTYNGVDDDCNPSTLDDDLDSDGYPLAQDCDDNNSAINPGATETTYNGLDDDCNSSTLDDDLDSDGYPLSQDCDDNDASINPGAVETVYNGVDDDCDPSTLDDDSDSDGYPLAQDCDDNDSSINPGATETAYNGIDDDCDPSTLDDDLDGDGYPLDQDCDDNDESINPGSEEICGDGIDQDCSGSDLTCPEDIDDDGDGYTENQGDCDDSNPAINPGAAETAYNGLDDDCNPSTLDDDLDSDGYPLDQDCDDNDANINPGAAEICGDGVDQDCSGSDLTCPEDIDDDGDGYTENKGDCDDSNPAINPGAAEICGDGVDQDCSGSDLTCPEDIDDDGDGYTENKGDCDDSNPAINPGAAETA
ncbi:MopE-related protein, partial [Thermodesulfobacteriota bacterium]